MPGPGNVPWYTCVSCWCAPSCRRSMRCSTSSPPAATIMSPPTTPAAGCSPGRHAGQPASYRGMLTQLRDLGLPMRTARISDLRQLVLQVPAPVIADALGFHHTTTTRQHINAGATWSQYAANRDRTAGPRLRSRDELWPRPGRGGLSERSRRP
jgi:hypothetical protein